MATIKPRRGTAAPTTGLSQYELAVDTTNKRIYIGNAGGSGDLIGSAPGGSDTQIQFNDSGVMGGDSGLTYNKTTDALTVAGDINANGGAIKTTQATFNLANATATTLNAGGGATAINMGSATCTTTISGGTVLGSTTTQALFDTVATTMNFARQATSITMGAATGFTAIRNPTFRLGSTTAAITTTSGASANNLTLEPFGKLRIVPTTNLSNGGSIPSLIVENSDQASGVVEIAGGDLYLGNKTVDDINYTPVNIIFEGVGNNTSETTLTVEEPTADRTITLPNATGTVALVAGSDTQIMFNDGGSVLGGDSALTYNKTTDTLSISGTTNTLDILASTDGVGLRIAQGSAGQTSGVGSIRLGRSSTAGNNTYISNNNGTFSISNGNDDNGTLLIQCDTSSIGIGTPILTIGGSAQAEIRLTEASANGSNYVALKAASSIASNVTWTLPSADGTSGQTLTTDGTGTLSWTTAAGGTPPSVDFLLFNQGII